ncbi:MAG: ABC transporter ATP-binding protein [Vampirovibrionales bacterium]|nr:ABC transporter ATP-binding protein [Vampirovibrionales bacterium]
MSLSPLLTVAKVSHTYPQHDTQALCDVSFTVDAGEFWVLMGPSGCGKSTLLNVLGAMDTPTQGEVLFAGQSLSSLSDNERTLLRRTHMGYVFQFFNLIPTLTVAENVALPLQLNQRSTGLSAKSIHAKVAELLSQLGLAQRADYYPSQLSGGEMQRAAIGRALIHQPKLLLADEPTGNLDTDNGDKVLQLLSTLCKERGTTIIMATHSEDVAKLGDTVLRLRNGRIHSLSNAVGV